MKLIYIFLSILISSSTAFSQSTIYGKVTDRETCEELIYANIVVKKDGVFYAGASTDFEGNYRIPIKDVGIYDVHISYTGYPDKKITGVIVENGRGSKLDIQMEVGISLETVVVVDYKVPLIETCSAMSGSTITSDRIKSLPTKNISALAATTAGLSTTDKGGDVTIRGSRSEATDYYIDGIRVSSEISLKPISAFSPEDLLSGTEAAFESATETESILVEIEDYMEAPAAPLEYTEEEVKPEPKPKAGILTAGEWNPLEHWSFWNDLLKNQDQKHKGIWGINPQERYQVKIVTKRNTPLPNVTVELVDSKGTIHWTAITDNEGKAELWGNLFEAGEERFKIVTEFQGVRTHPKNAKAFNDNKVNKIKIPVGCQSFDAADILFVVDATGSMGDEINYLKSELQDVIKNVQKSNQQLDIQTGCVFYKDKSDEYITRVSPLSDKINTTTNFISKQFAGGGGDYPEAVDAALEAAMQQEWRPNAIARIVFLLLDAPPHQQPEVLAKLQKNIKAAAEKGIRIIPIAASGIDPSTEFLMKAIATATNGTYVFITDDSGVGNAHLKPTVSDFEVEFLNDLMVRLITDFTEQKSCQNKNKYSSKTTTPIVLEQSFNINFYPNPAQDFITLDLERDLERLDISNLNGQVIRSILSIKKGTSKINLSDLIDGVYVLQFHKKDGVVNKKLVVSRKS